MQTISHEAPQRLVIASGDAGKIREFQALLALFNVTVESQKTLGVKPCPEPYGTFVENCLAKARNAARVTGFPAMADDSGICVNALGGAPGVHSSRFAGEEASDAENNALLIKCLAGTADRRARYVCVLCAVRSPDDPEPLIADGAWEGEIIDEPRGSGGFGYDPYFLLPQMGKTAAELSAEEKNARSHRGQALSKMLGLLEARWGWRRG